MTRLDRFEHRPPGRSYCGDLIERHPATSPTGREIRRGDALRRLAEMDAVEHEVREGLVEPPHAADRLAWTRAARDLQTRYLVAFGVTADERGELRRVLEEVGHHGGLTLRESINLASARARHAASVALTNGPVSS